MALTMTVAPDQYSFPLRFHLTVTASPSVDTPLWVWRVHEDGSVWPVIVEQAARLIAGSWQGYDYHAPRGQLVGYYATTVDQTSATVAGTVVSDKGMWLIPADDPASTIAVHYVDSMDGDGMAPDSVGVFKVIDGGHPVAVPDGSPEIGVTVTASLTVAVLREDLAAALLVLRRGRPLLVLCSPLAGWDVSWRWIQPTGQKVDNPGANTMPGGSAGYPYRNIALSYTWIQQPDTDITGLWTSADAEAYWTAQGQDSAGMETKYATAQDLENDTRL